MGRLLALVAALLWVGCGPTQKPPVTITVRTPDTQPVAGAVVGWLCTPEGDGAAVSDASGAATVVIFNSEPKTCTVTVAKIGFRTQQLENQPLGPIDVTLEPSP